MRVDGSRGRDPDASAHGVQIGRAQVRGRGRRRDVRGAGEPRRGWGQGDGSGPVCGRSGGRVPAQRGDASHGRRRRVRREDGSVRGHEPEDVQDHSHQPSRVVQGRPQLQRQDQGRRRAGGVAHEGGSAGRHPARQARGQGDVRQARVHGEPEEILRRGLPDVHGFRHRRGPGAHGQAAAVYVAHLCLLWRRLFAQASRGGWRLERGGWRRVPPRRQHPHRQAVLWPGRQQRL
mmetsp:Transcript_9220/g.37187  ORF Transcript_9220/g.37187 Transcript_9220/m.37187 type:complete len:233 (+) Transcript_9220:752-1450(+)